MKACDHDQVLINYCIVREANYRRLGEQRRKLALLRKGWVNRLNGSAQGSGLARDEPAVPLDFGENRLIKKSSYMGENPNTISERKERRAGSTRDTRRPVWHT
jgi:hypothetical protein